MTYNIKAKQIEFDKVCDWLKTEYTQINTGRATPVLLDGIKIESYGTMQDLRNVASVTIEDPKTLRIAPWDKNVVKTIEKALVDSNLSLGVAADSDGIRLNFPPLTGERRVQIVKVLSSLKEDARISIRKVRESELKDIAEAAKSGGMGEDDKKRLEQDLQKMVDAANNNLDSIFKTKETEVLGN
jgi:ribosome recycling factor